MIETAGLFLGILLQCTLLLRGENLKNILYVKLAFLIVLVLAGGIIVLIEPTALNILYISMVYVFLFVGSELPRILPRFSIPGFIVGLTLGIFGLYALIGKFALILLFLPIFFIIKGGKKPSLKSKLVYYCMFMFFFLFSFVFAFITLFSFEYNSFLENLFLGFIVPFAMAPILGFIYLINSKDIIAKSGKTYSLEHRDFLRARLIYKKTTLAQRLIPFTVFVLGIVTGLYYFDTSMVLSTAVIVFELTLCSFTRPPFWKEIEKKWNKKNKKKKLF